MQDAHKTSSRVWLWQSAGPGAWHFVTISKKDADLIKQDWHWPRRGFGSIPVSVQVGKTQWQTSIFPEKEGSYLLPLKKQVREEEKIKAGDTVILFLKVLS